MENRAHRVRSRTSEVHEGSDCAGSWDTGGEKTGSDLSLRSRLFKLKLVFPPMRYSFVRKGASRCHLLSQSRKIHSARKRDQFLWASVRSQSRRKTNSDQFL